jgi:tetratricopeptide (TPR) repeat protein
MEYVRRQLPQLPPAQSEDIHRLHTITLGNPFLLERVTRLMAEWQPAWRWEATQWEPLIDSYRKDDRHGLLLFVTQRLLTHVLQDDTAFWRLALPRHSVHRDMADLLFPAHEFPDASGEERLKIYESKGLIYRGQEHAHFFVHDETRAALQAWAEHRKVWLDNRASVLHVALGDWFAQTAGWPWSYPDPFKDFQINGNSLLFEAAYHRVMANSELETKHRRHRRELWEQLSMSIALTNAGRLAFAHLLSDPSFSNFDIFAQLREESIAYGDLLSTEAFAWLQEQSQLGSLPANWVQNSDFLRKAIAEFPLEGNLIALLAESLEIISPDEANIFFRRSLEAEPNNARVLSSYARFLNFVYRKYEEAEAIYRRVIDISPRDASDFGNLAQLILARGEYEEGRALIDRAFAAEPEPPLQLELWFYRFAHFPQDYPEAVKAIEALLAEGVRSPGWDLSITLAQAAREGHPDPVRLEALAVRLASDPPTAAGEASNAH